MEKITLHILTGDVDAFRKAISLSSKNFPFEFTEDKTPEGILFVIDPKHPEAAYRLGYTFGTVKEFRSRHFDHRERKFPEGD